jgi:hypothetical protein
MFGNQYGNATTFPVRRAMPTSDQVMSDPEFQADWQSRLDAIPQTIGTGERGADKQIQLVPGASGWDASAAEQVFMRNPSLRDPSVFGTSAYNQANNAATKGGSHLFTQKGEQIMNVNPEWQRLKNEMDAAMQKRQEAQTANQQAYDGMLGQGQKNGVMGAGYSNPGFGRVDGMAQNPYAVNAQDNNNPAFAGYQQDTTGLTGVYDPIAQTKELFWGL